MKLRPVRAWMPSLLLIVGACGLFAGTFLEWHARVDVEGAYFHRAAGAPAYAGVFSAWGNGDDAWHAFAGLDIAMAVFAALALLAGLVALPAGWLRLPRVFLATGVAGLGVGAWTLERVFDRPGLVGLGPGAVLGFAAVAVACIGALLAAAMPGERYAPEPPA